MRPTKELIIKVIAKILAPFYYLYKRFTANNYFRDAKVKRAVRLHKKNGLRYRVAIHDGRWMCYNRLEFKDYKRTGFFQRQLTYNKLEDLDIIYFDTNML